MRNLDKKAKVEALKDGKGIQYLLDEAYKIFGNPILMHDLDYTAVAHTKNDVTDDPLWNEFVSTGGFGKETIELFKNEGIIDIGANTKTITVLTSDKLKYDRLFCKVYNKDNIVVAGVDILACYKPFEDDDSEIFEVFCKILSQEVGKSEFYLSYGRTYQENLIRKLIDGSIEDKRLYPVHVDIIYNGLKKNIFLAVADIAQCDPEHTKLAYFRDLFKQTQPAFKYAIYANYIVIILSSDDPEPNVKKDLSKLEKLFEQNNIYVGISSCFENLYELRKYYNEALSALDYGLKSHSGRRVFFCGETGIAGY